MPNKKTEDFISRWKPEIDFYLEKEVDRIEGVGILKEAVSYALFNGGKRVRPLFFLAVLECFKSIEKEENVESIIQKSISFELFHNFTLVQDDLPCMDNDEARRGMPSLWKKFGESTALLASDVLLGMSFKVAGSNPTALIEMLMPDSLIGGQFLDLDTENKHLNLEQINKSKTADFFMQISQVACRDLGLKTKDTMFMKLKSFSLNFGLYFQYRDDYFDVKSIDEKKILKKKMNFHIEKQKSLLEEMNLQDSVLGGFSNWLIDKE